MKKVYLISVSGGKDSQATWIYMLKEYSNNLIVPYFADTGWESEITYEHLKYLEKTLNSKIEVIGSSKYKSFENLCIKKKAFPSRVGRFCTEELKIKPSNEFIKSWQEKGYRVINVTGVRKDESKNIYLKEPKIKNGVKWWVTPRREAEHKWKFSFFYPCSKTIIRKGLGVIVYQPIIDWTAKEVLTYNIVNGTRNNPLYSKGLTRVGCYPCIMANKFEIGSLSNEAVIKVNDLEKKVQATTTNTRPVFFHKGGKLMDFKDIYAKYQYNALDFDLGCINQYGICE